MQNPTYPKPAPHRFALKRCRTLGGCRTESHPYTARTKNDVNPHPQMRACTLRRSRGSIVATFNGAGSPAQRVGVAVRWQVFGGREATMTDLGGGFEGGGGSSGGDLE